MSKDKKGKTDKPTVKWFEEKKGFGLITPDPGTSPAEPFKHLSALTPIPAGKKTPRGPKS